MNKIITKIRQNYPICENQIYPTLITDYDLTDFYSSDYIFGISSWNRHARILIKNQMNLDIMIMDPWMDNLPRIVSSNLLAINKIKIGFFRRIIKDQKSNEGSCGLCVLARVFHLVLNNGFSKEIVNQPIPDFCAYWVNLFRYEN